MYIYIYIFMYAYDKLYMHARARVCVCAFFCFSNSNSIKLELIQQYFRSATCPHCRQVASTNKIHRIYFSFGNDKAIQEFLDLPLERQINNLKFQILLKEKDINYYASKSVILEKQNSGLRQEVRKVESEIKQKDSVIHDLKEQMLRLKKKRLDYEILKKKLSQKEKELQQYKQYVLFYIIFI